MLVSATGNILYWPDPSPDLANFLPPIPDNLFPTFVVDNSSSAEHLMKFFKSTLASILGSLIGGGILLFLLFLVLSNLFTPSSPELELNEPVYLKMELKGPILEKADATPVRMQGLDLPELGGASGLYEITQGIKTASKDDMVAGIYLRIRNVDAGWAKMTTLREALLDFKAAGKKIVAWSDSYDERSLYLASVADDIYLHPVGDVELNGFAATPLLPRQYV